MSKVPFDEAIQKILSRETRYAAEAYAFLRDSLEFTIKGMQKGRARQIDHVTGAELCRGCRDHAIQQYGPMVPIIMEEWGLRSTRDIGIMVFHLIESGAFSKSESDCLDDFVDVYTFEEAFVKPFQPKRGMALGHKETIG